MSVENNNSHNLLYFESDSMRGLYDTMGKWQQDNGKRLLSTNIQRENGKVCCIALSNPGEVILVSGSTPYSAEVSEHGYVRVTNGRYEVYGRNEE